MSNLYDNYWHHHYGDEEYFYGTAPNDFLKEASKYIAPNSSVLSLGEGEGRNAVFLAEQGHCVTAIDMALSGLQKTEKLALQRGVEVNIIHADLSNFELAPKAWGAAINIFCHIPRLERKRLHQQIQNSLKKGGVYICECYNTKQLEYKTGGPNRIDLLYTIDELKKDFADMEIVHLANVVREIHEGYGHTGLSAVVQIIARKR